MVSRTVRNHASQVYCLEDDLEIWTVILTVRRIDYMQTIQCSSCEALQGPMIRTHGLVGSQLLPNKLINREEYFDGKRYT